VGPSAQTPRRSAHVEDDHAQIVEPVDMIGVGMGVDHPVEPPDARIEQLLAQVGRGVDQDGCLPALVEALHQHGTAAAGVARLVRVAIAPMAAEARHTAGGAAAEDGEAQLRHAQAAFVPAAARVNSRSKFAVVAAANSASVTPKTSAPTRAVCTV
jgi:hypothetical protein